jgi:hypothetical protein
MPEYNGEPMFEARPFGKRWATRVIGAEGIAIGKVVNIEGLQEPIYIHQKTIPATEDTWQQPVIDRGTIKEWEARLDEIDKEAEDWWKRNNPETPKQGDTAAQTIGLSEVEQKQQLWEEVIAMWQKADTARWQANDAIEQLEKKYPMPGKKH